MEQLLPLKRENFSGISIPADIHQEEIRMVPSPEAVMDHVVPNYVTGFIFGALVESFCSEQNERMMAMQSASDNAAALLSELSMEYNRLRQAAITQEITEIVGGAQRKDDDGPPRPKLNPTRTVRFSADGNRIDNQ